MQRMVGSFPVLNFKPESKGKSFLYAYIVYPFGFKHLMDLFIDCVYGFGFKI